MADVLIYWRDYRKNAIGQNAGWHSNSRLLGKLMPGDRMWMVASGKSLGHEAEQAGFLVAVWQVAQAGPNPGDDPAYPTDRYRYRIVPNEGESITLSEPVPVDHILRGSEIGDGSLSRYSCNPVLPRGLCLTRRLSPR